MKCARCIVDRATAVQHQNLADHHDVPLAEHRIERPAELPEVLDAVTMMDGNSLCLEHAAALHVAPDELVAARLANEREARKHHEQPARPEG